MSARTLSHVACFNEAPDRSRGKELGRPGDYARHDAASMRPRPKSREGVEGVGRSGRVLVGFNEAPDRSRGKGVAAAMFANSPVALQ